MCILFIWGIGESATFTFENRGDRTAVYMLWWLDHDFGGFYPANMAGGEVNPGATRGPMSDYPGEKWMVFFGYAYEEHSEVLLEVQNGMHVHFIWDGERIIIE
jgi:hypothetical protein